MKRSRTGSFAGEVHTSPPVATVQVPLPLLDVLQDTRTAFFGLCLDAGQQVLRTMMEEDREQLCGPKHVPNPERGAYRSGSTRGEVTLGGRRILVPRLRARSMEGHELALPSFTYAAGRDPLNARTLEAIAIGVTTRQYRRALDPLPVGTRERAVAKSSVSRRFVALTTTQLASWLTRPLDGLAIRIIFIDGLHFREHVVLIALGVTGALYRTLRSTNAIENLNGRVGHFVHNVRRWRDGRMLVRWIAAGLQEVRRGFRRLRGHRDLAALIRALDRTVMDSRKEVA